MTVAVIALAVLIGVLVQHNTSNSNKKARDAFGAGQPFAAPSGVTPSPGTTQDPGASSTASPGPR